jgi:hypothetical protein
MKKGRASVMDLEMQRSGGKRKRYAIMDLERKRSRRRKGDLS